MNNGYLVPANTKRSNYILGMLRVTPDLWILLTGTISSIVALMITSTWGMLYTIISLIPVLIAVFLVLPIPNYHNTLCLLQSIIRFYNERRIYIWKGWCMKYEPDDDKK